MSDLERARALKAQYDQHKFSDPSQANAAAETLGQLAASSTNTEIRALADWTAGMAALHLNGRAADALPLTDRAAEGFLALGNEYEAATIQLTRMHALGLLGHYDAALAAGEWAAQVFASAHDAVAAGKVEQNLGNLSMRRDDYAAAERFYRSARDRFMATDDPALLARAENNLGFALMQRHKFGAATETLERALERAEQAGAGVTQAEIEDNLGCLGLVQGRYDQALDYLERARRRLVALDKPHDAAIADRELADAYLELNLVHEAAEIYERVVPAFEQLGMRAELAWALVHQARAYQSLGRVDEAAACLSRAHDLYVNEGNSVGRAMTTLARAQLHYQQRELEDAARCAVEVEEAFDSAGVWSRLLQARWLRGDALRILGRTEAARLLERTLRDARAHGIPQIELRCLTSLGLHARARGDDAVAVDAFVRATELVEQLRAPLPGDQFRSAFFGQHLLPYVELARLRLERGEFAAALTMVERARSRALLDLLGNAEPSAPPPEDVLERQLAAQLASAREQLNWMYARLNRAMPGVEDAATSRLDAQSRECEARILTLGRQLQQRRGHGGTAATRLDLTALQQRLGCDAALVEYFSLDGMVLAFVLTDAGVHVVRSLANEPELITTIQQLRFQIDTPRLGSERLGRHMEQLASRARFHLQKLYRLLLAPLEALIGDRRLAIVPHGALHYLPFQALHDGDAYLVERHEIVYAPSAGVLQHCLAQPRGPLEHALLVGVPDARAPRTRQEIETVASLFDQPEVLLAEAARVASVRESASHANVLHLACHGQFRPDSPLFSALQMADGRLTVRDAAALDLARCQLVVLSACETGVSALAAGDEIVGLTRGFLAAGAPSLVVSLWTVDDATTAELMRLFYERLRLGDSTAAALRHAQRFELARQPHPFFWSAFGVVGRW